MSCIHDVSRITKYIKRAVTVSLLGGSLLMMALSLSLFNCSTVRDVEVEPPVRLYTRPEGEPTSRSIDLYVLGEQAFAERNFPLAARLFKQADIFDSRNVSIKERLLESYVIIAKNDSTYYRKVKDLAQEYIEEELITPQIYRLTGKAHFSLDEADKGLNLMKLALEIDPHPYHYYDYFIYQARYSEYLNFLYLEKALENGWKYPELVFRIAELYKYHRPLRSKEVLEKAYEKFNQDKQSLSHLLEFYVDFKDWSNFNRVVEERFEAGKTVTQEYKELYISHLFHLEEYWKINNAYDRFRHIEDKNVTKYLFYSMFQIENWPRAIDSGFKLLEKNELETDEINLISIYIGKAYYYSGNYYKAIESFSGVSEPFMLYGAFRRLNEKDEQFEVKQILDDMLERDTEQVTADLVLTIYTLHENNLEETSKYLQSALQADKENDELWKALAVLLLEENLEQDAYTTLSKVTDPDFSTNIFLGDYYYHIEKDSLAKKHFEDGINDNPEAPVSAYLSLASLYNRNKLHDKELQLMEKAVELFPDDALILNWYGYSLTILTERYEEAKGYLLKAIELEPDNHYIQDSVAWLYYKLHDYQKALHYMKDIIDSGVEYSVISYHIGMIYLKLDEFEKAALYLDKAVELNNDDEYVGKAKDKLLSIGVNYE